MKEKLAMLDYAKLLGHNISVNSPKKTTIEIFIDNKRSPKNLLITEQESNMWLLESNNHLQVLLTTRGISIFLRELERLSRAKFNCQNT